MYKNGNSSGVGHSQSVSTFENILDIDLLQLFNSLFLDVRYHCCSCVGDGDEEEEDHRHHGDSGQLSLLLQR